MKTQSWYSARTRLGALPKLNPEARPLIGPINTYGDFVVGSPSSDQEPCAPMSSGKGGDGLYEGLFAKTESDH